MLTAPFPYFGNKSRWVNDVWSRLGKVSNYCEPFAGSLAVLLGNPNQTEIEIANDTDGYVTNFWRSVQRDPEAVAHWADCPVSQHELSARSKWLSAWDGSQLAEDVDWYDARCAGYWCWWKSAKINGITPDRQYTGRPSTQLVSKNRNAPSMMVPLASRLRRVVLLNGEWSKLVTSGCLNPAARANIAVFLDPPYRGRDSQLYVDEHQSADVAEASYEWALEHGERYRIAYAMHAGDFPVPSGWDSVERRFKHPQAKRKRDQIIFSPACIRPEEGLL